MNREKSRTYQKLGEDKLQEMFEVYLHKPTVSHVAGVCGVAERTVRLWKNRGKWDERRNKVLSQAEKNTNGRLADLVSQHLTICARTREILYDQFLALDRKAEVVSETPSRLAKSLIEIMRFERLLHSQNDHGVQVRGEFTERVDAIMDAGGERAEKLRNMFAQLTDLVIED